MKHLVIGYHGTDSTASRAMRRDGFDKSRVESPGWLGPGLYFWEQDEQKAWYWAATRKGLRNAAVLRAQLDLSEDVLDLTTTKWKSAYAEFLSESAKLQQNLQQAGIPKRSDDRFWLPVFMKAVANTEGIGDWGAVRSVVLEGDRAYHQRSTRSLTALPQSAQSLPKSNQLARRNQDLYRG